MGKHENEEDTSIDMQRTAKDAKAVPSPGGGGGGSGPLDNHLTSKLANFSLRQPLHLEKEAKVWSKPEYSSSSSSSETSPTCPIVPWDPASMTPLKVKVKTGKKFHSDPRLIYPMSSSPRGLALIINNIEFTIPEIYPFRKGAEVDSENLAELFTQLGFKVEKHLNLGRTETFRVLIDFAARTEHKDADMVIVCILSHGTHHGRVVAADCLELEVEVDILRRFNNDYCPELKGKPKFFILQACRGEDEDYGTLELQSRDATDAKPRSRSMSSMSPPGVAAKGLTWEDILIAFATLPGYISNRDHFRGTWFIESLSKVIMNHAKDTSLRDMLDLVGLELRDYESETGRKQSFSYDVRHFYKKLFFNPGHTSDPKEKWKHESVLRERKRAMSSVVPPNLGHHQCREEEHEEEEEKEEEKGEDEGKEKGYEEESS